MFLGAPFEPAWWFSAGGVAIYQEAALLPDYAGPQPHEDALVNASLLSRAWLSGDADAAGQFIELAARFGSRLFFCINDTSDAAAARSACRPLQRSKKGAERFDGGADLGRLQCAFECHGIDPGPGQGPVRQQRDQLTT